MLLSEFKKLLQKELKSFYVIVEVVGEVVFVVVGVVRVVVFRVVSFHDRNLKF